MIIDLELVSKEFLSLVDLIKAQALHIHELTEVIIVSKDEYLVFAAFSVVVLSFEDFNNSQELLNVSLVSSFGRYHFSKKKTIKCH